jgi:hypothetical protein
MRLPPSIQTALHQGARQAGTRPYTLLGHFLPPDPKPPERPTIPPPSCGTLPPQLPLLLEWLGSTKRKRR